MPAPASETKARPAATPLAIGMAISLVGWPVLGAAVYTGLRQPNGLAPSAPLALLGWVLVIVGAALVGLGVHRLVQHADRAAGVRFVRDARGRAVWTTAQPAESVPPEWAAEERRRPPPRSAEVRSAALVARRPITADSCLLD